MSKPRLYVEVGQRIGAGVVIETGIRIRRRDGKMGGAARLVCDCGGEYAVLIYRLAGQRKPVQSCGCLTRKLQSESAIRARTLPQLRHGIIDHTGQRYGRLVVVEMGPRAAQGQVQWLCRCDCGNEKIAKAECLTKGITRSCGCERVFRLPPGAATRNRVLRGYKKAAAERGLPWELTEADFDLLTSQDCHYCGVRPSATATGVNGSFIYNGIDRVDNTAGYIASNVVTCCTLCNRAKMDLPYGEWVAWIGRLTAYQMFSPAQLPSRLLKKAS